MHESLKQDQLYVTVDLLILTVRNRELTLLLSRRSAVPYAGMPALPGSFVAVDESAEAAARRLLDEMFPVEEAYLEQLYTFTEVNRDPRGRVISSAYLVIVPPAALEAELKEHAGGFQPYAMRMGPGGLRLIGEDGTELAKSDLAFDHGRIAETGLLRLQGKIEYTEIGFRFLNDLNGFSLGELQTVYEAVLGHSEDSSNFRRFIRSRYEETGKIIPARKEGKQVRGRPAKLYQYQQDK